MDGVNGNQVNVWFRRRAQRCEKAAESVVRGLAADGEESAMTPSINTDIAWAEGESARRDEGKIKG